MAADPSSDQLAQQLADLQVPQDLTRCGNNLFYCLKALSHTEDCPVSSIWYADCSREHSAKQISSGQHHDHSPIFSPDGKTIAFISDRSTPGKSSAILSLTVPPVRGEGARLLTPRSNLKSITSFAWSPDSKYIAYTSADEESVAQKVKRRARDDVEVYGENWEYARLRVVDVSSGNTVTIEDTDEGMHVESFAWNYKSPLHQLTSRASGSASVTFQVRSMTSSSSARSCVGWLAGFHPEKEFSSRTTYTMSIDEREWSCGDVLTPTQCVIDLKLDAASQIWTKVQSGLFDMIKGPEEHDMGFDCQIDSWDVTPASKVAVVKSDPAHPPEVFSTRTGRKAPLLQLSNHGRYILSENLVGKAAHISCIATDGEMVEGILTTPQAFVPGQSRPLPALVFIHGGPYDRVSVSFKMPHYCWVPYFVAAGYAVLCPNYRGGSGQGEKHASAARGEIGTVEYDDIIALVRRAVQQSFIDKDRVGIGGWSQGGLLSYLSVTRSSTFRFQAAVCGAGVSDVDMATMSTSTPYFAIELAGVAPWQTSVCDTRGRHGSAIWNMKDIPKDKKTPVLIVHGKEDKQVPVSQARAFHRACLYNDIPCEMAIYPREGHMFQERPHMVDMLKRMKRFYDRDVLQS